MFAWEHAIALQGHGFSPFAADICGIFSSYGGDDPSKLVFVQRCQDSFLVMRDTYGISTSLGRAIWMLLELTSETENPFLVATMIF